MSSVKQWAQRGDYVRKDGDWSKVVSIDLTSEHYLTDDGGCIGFEEIEMADVMLESEVEG